MKKKHPIDLEPEPNEVRFDYFLARTLRAFSSANEYREALKRIYVDDTEAVATDGQTIVRIPWERPDLKTGNVWLVHRDALTVAKRKDEALFLNMASGGITVRGSGVIYPIRLPNAEPNGDTPDTRYPEFEKIFKPVEVAATFAVNPEFVSRAVQLMGKTGRAIVLDVPKNSTENSRPLDGVPHVDRGIPFYVLGGKGRGLIMPILVRRD